MIKKILLIYRYTKFRLYAKTRYNIHSHFVYSFIEDIIRDNTHYSDYKKLWNHRNKLAASSDPVETVDFGFGAGEKAYTTNIYPLSRIVKRRSHSESRLRLLYRIVKYYKPLSVLEFGTAAGISATYIKYGYPKSNMVTMEGCANLASKAEESFNELGIKNIDIAVGNFNNILANVLDKFNSLDFVFFDGNHRMEPTLMYFESCAKLSNENSIFVFDDIHWSSGMEEAWRRIKEDERVSVTIDLFWFGLVFFRKGIEKQNFNIVV